MAHDMREAVLKYICDFRTERGYSPSLREIGLGLGLSSTSAVRYHVCQLERAGLLQRQAGRGRTLVPAGPIRGDGGAAS